MNISDIRAAMEHNTATRAVGMALCKVGFVHLLHTIQANKKRKALNGGETEFAAFFDNHKMEFQKVYGMLGDDKSRETFKAIVRFRKNYDIKVLNKVISSPQYFLKDILPPSDNEIFIDGGAYIGDTSKDFLKLYNGDNYEKIYLWEPDTRNKAEIRKMLGRDAKYEVKPYAMWSERTELNFSDEGTGTSSVGESGVLVSADSIDNQHQSECVTFIKMDIEGAVIEALKGAEKTIKRCKPKLAICIYHEPDHLYRIPLMIKEIVPEYRIYIRHHSDTASETVCYAVV